MGIAVDNQFREVVEGNRRLSSTAYLDRRCYNALAVLRADGVDPVRAHFPVKYNGIKTELDGLGYRKGGRAVVIELKNVMCTIADFNKMCQRECKNMPTIRGVLGVSNTKMTGFQLQTGFGMLALRHCSSMPPDVPIDGVVVVIGTDAAMLYHVQQRYAKECMFAPAVTALAAADAEVTACPAPSGKRMSFLRVPPHAVARNKLMVALDCTMHLARLKYGSAVFTRKDDTYVVVGLVVMKHEQKTISKNKQTALQEEAARLSKKKRGQRVLPVLAALRGGRYTTFPLKMMVTPAGQKKSRKRLSKHVV